MANDKVLVFKTDTNKLEYEDKATGGGGSAGHITILPLSYDSIGQGNWIWLNRSAYMGGFFYNVSNNDNDEISYKAELTAGIYTLYTVIPTAYNQGIRKWYIDNIEVASFDGYTPTIIYNTIQKQTGIIITTTGIKTIKMKCVGKNPLSSGYHTNIQSCSLWRNS